MRQSPFKRSGIVGLALVSALLALTPAWAGDGDDIVHLANGGRVRGTVFDEDPVKGVTVKLLDGTTRTIPMAEVARVQYGPAAAAAAPAPAPAPPPAPAAPVLAPVPSYGPMAAPVYPPRGGHGAGDVPEVRQRRSTGLMVTGIVLMGVGAVSMAAGGALFAAGGGGDYDDCVEYSDYDYESGYYETDSSGCGGNSTMKTAGIGMLIGGGSAIGLGLFFTIFGASKKGGAAASATSPATSVPDVAVGLGSARLRWAF